MLTVTAEQRRHRLAARHCLQPDHRAGTVEEVAGALIGLHSSDPATVYMSAWARMREPTKEKVEAALYEARSLVRVLGMRRTMFVVETGTAPLLVSGCAAPLADAERRRLAGYLEGDGIASDGFEWIDRVGEETLRALDRRGEAFATDLRKDVPDLMAQITFGEGKTWGGKVGVSTRMLFLLATDGQIIRGKPRGSWISSQYRWVHTSTWIDGGIPTIDLTEAKVALVGRYLERFGPVTEADIKWWTGWNLGDVRAALTELDVAEVEVDTGAAFMLATDTHDGEANDWAALLPSLDPTIMGWRNREWYLPADPSDLYDRNGNAGPTVWWNGRVIGGWGQRIGGEIAIELLEDPGSEARAALDVEAHRLHTLLDGTVVTPRFRTPLERRLRG